MYTSDIKSLLGYFSAYFVFDSESKDTKFKVLSSARSPEIREMDKWERYDKVRTEGIPLPYVMVDILQTRINVCYVCKDGAKNKVTIPYATDTDVDNFCLRLANKIAEIFDSNSLTESTLD